MRVEGTEEAVIYCEAACTPEDVLYEGSDDEDYDSPASRRLRYEAAGQRFLDGQPPCLLTATLRGPFDSASWANPWRSKHRTPGASRGERQSPQKLPKSVEHNRNASVAETQFGQHDSLECHLPSPESVKQVPLAATHPFLEEDELSLVQRWRNSVQRVGKDGFWATTPKGNMLDRKRKAKGSEWLRKLASKRQRTDLFESDSVDTPVPKQPTSLRGENETYDVFSSSFNSLPDRLPSSVATARTLRRHESADFVQGKAGDEEEDELVDSVSVSFSSAPTCLGSPRKRRSPRKSPKTRAMYEAAKDSEDELSRDEIAAIKAAATLSSPVSQHQLSQPHARGSPRHILSRQALEKQSPSRKSLLQKPLMDTKGSVESTDSDEQNLATQRDESFCFKMAAKDAKDGDSQSEDQSDSWSGISNSEKEPAAEIGGAQDTCTETVNPTKPMTVHESGAMEVDNDSTSSELSSVASQDVKELNYYVATENSDVDTTSDSGTSSASDTASKTCGEPELSEGHQASSTVGIMEPDDESIKVASVDIENDSGQEHAQEKLEGPMTVSKEHDSRGESPAGNSTSDSTSDSECDGTKSISSEVSEPEAPQSIAEKSPALPEHLGLLKCSVKRFVPQSSWAKLSRSIGQSSSSPTRLAPRLATKLTTSPMTPKPLKIEKPSTISSRLPSQLSSPMTLPIENSSVETSQPLKSQQSLIQDKSTHAVDPESIPASQQSPWASTQLSQYASLAIKDLPRRDASLGTPEKMDVPPLASSDAQTPWTNASPKLPMAPPQDAQSKDNANPQSASHTVDTACSISSQVQNKASSSGTPAMAPPLRPSTPEPQFSFKSMASFMSPSPERRPHSNRHAAWPDSDTRLSSIQCTLASATENPWSADVSQRRVSWAPLPHEMSRSAATSQVPSPTESRTRHASPPPTTPIAELPTSEDAKFHDHFSAVARRSGSTKPTSGLRNRLLPTASQRSFGSPMPQAMAETFLAVDQFQKPTISTVDTSEDTSEDTTGMDRPGEHSQESQEPIDIVEDVMREMGDYLGTWDVDMELDLARKDGGGMQTPQLTQSPW